MEAGAKSQTVLDCFEKKTGLANATKPKAALSRREEQWHGLPFATRHKTNSRSLFMEIVAPVFDGKLIGNEWGRRPGPLF
jgi:hypothetical protein